MKKKERKKLEDLYSQRKTFPLHRPLVVKEANYNFLPFNTMRYLFSKPNHMFFRLSVLLKKKVVGPVGSKSYKKVHKKWKKKQGKIPKVELVRMSLRPSNVHIEHPAPGQTTPPGSVFLKLMPKFKHGITPKIEPFTDPSGRESFVIRYGDLCIDAKGRVANTFLCRFSTYNAAVIALDMWKIEQLPPTLVSV